MDNKIYIDKISISGMFHTSDIEWDLRKDVNILGGKNGDGKTTILKAAYQLLSMGTILSEKLRDSINGARILLSNGDTINWEKNANGQINQIPVVSVRFINSFEQLISNAEFLKIESNLKDQEKTFLDVLIEKELNTRNAIFADTFASILSSLRNGDRLHPVSSEEVTEYFSFYNSVNRFMSEYSSEIGNDLAFSRKAVNKDRIPYTRLSMGEKQLLLILLMAHNTRKSNCIFIMDEPDLGMHIGWKEILIKELRAINPNMQLILSTHSPSMIEGWYDNVREISQLKS